MLYNIYYFIYNYCTRIVLFIKELLIGDSWPFSAAKSLKLSHDLILIVSYREAFGLRMRIVNPLCWAREPTAHFHLSSHVSGKESSLTLKVSLYSTIWETYTSWIETLTLNVLAEGAHVCGRHGCTHMCTCVWRSSLNCSPPYLMRQDLVVLASLASLLAPRIPCC